MAGARTSGLFSIPTLDREIMRSWDAFMADGRKTPSWIRSSISDSWHRCRDGAVDVSRDRAPQPVVADQLERLKDASRELVDAGAPVMASARDFLIETGTVMVLTDARGVVLSLEGDRTASLQNAIDKIHLLPGADWSELTCGTNAIGTALQTKAPIQVHSSEHFCEGIKKWTCSACVIRDPYDHSILGVIDVSGLRDSYSRHSMALVVDAAKRIEARVSETENVHRLRLLDRCFWDYAPRSTDHVVVFDRRGRVVTANDDVEAILRSLDAPSLVVESCDPERASHWTLPDPLPAWMDRQWLNEVRSGDERLGMVLIAPKVPSRSHSLPRPNPRPRKAEPFADMVVESPGMRAAVTRALRAAQTSANILLLGETGVGKELFARSIHAASAVAEGPFVALNCGGLNRDLLTSELFGYGEGAFTGARKGGMVGKLEAAGGGTLFLDELGEMPLDVQPTFLRALETREVCRIGETRPRSADFRLIVATNADLARAVEERRFRADLYYRVSVVSLAVPALRERPEEIPALAEAIGRQLAKQQGVTPKPLTPGALEFLKRHAWPGNVRELRNVIEAMHINAVGSELTVADLPASFVANPVTAAPAPAPALKGLASAERDAIRESLRRARGNITEAARHLGMAKSTLYTKLRRYELVRELEATRRREGDPA